MFVDCLAHVLILQCPCGFAPRLKIRVRCMGRFCGGHPKSFVQKPGACCSPSIVSCSGGAEELFLLGGLEWQPNSHGPQPNTNGLQPNNDGLQPRSNGLPPILLMVHSSLR